MPAWESPQVGYAWTELDVARKSSSSPPTLSAFYHDMHRGRVEESPKSISVSSSGRAHRFLDLGLEEASPFHFNFAGPLARTWVVIHVMMTILTQF